MQVTACFVVRPAAGLLNFQNINNLHSTPHYAPDLNRLPFTSSRYVNIPPVTSALTERRTKIYRFRCLEKLSKKCGMKGNPPLPPSGCSTSFALSALSEPSRLPSRTKINGGDGLDSSDRYIRGLIRAAAQAGVGGAEAPEPAVMSPNPDLELGESSAGDMPPGDGQAGEGRQGWWLASWWAAQRQQSRELADKLRSYGVAGLAAYGLCNTLYYTLAFLFVWLYVSPSPRGLGYARVAERFTKLLAMVWAGSQVTKLPRAGGALLLAPAADKVLIWLSLKLNLKSRSQALALVGGACVLLALAVFGSITCLWA